MTLTKRATSVLIADRRPVYAEAIKTLLEGAGGIRAVAVEPDVESLARTASRIGPDVVVCSGEPPRSLSLTAAREVRRCSPSIPVLLLLDETRRVVHQYGHGSGGQGYGLVVRRSGEVRSSHSRRRRRPHGVWSGIHTDRFGDTQPAQRPRTRRAAACRGGPVAACHQRVARNLEVHHENVSLRCDPQDGRLESARGGKGRSKGRLDVRKSPAGAGLCWSRRPDSNRRPAIYETAALPTELRRRLRRQAPRPPWVRGPDLRPFPGRGGTGVFTPCVTARARLRRRTIRDSSRRGARRAGRSTAAGPVPRGRSRRRPRCTSPPSARRSPARRLRHRSCAHRRSARRSASRAPTRHCTSPTSWYVRDLSITVIRPGSHRETVFASDDLPGHLLGLRVPPDAWIADRVELHATVVTGAGAADPPPRGIAGRDRLAALVVSSALRNLLLARDPARRVRGRRALARVRMARRRKRVASSIAGPVFRDRSAAAGSEPAAAGGAPGVCLRRHAALHVRIFSARFVFPAWPLLGLWGIVALAAAIDAANEMLPEFFTLPGAGRPSPRSRSRSRSSGSAWSRYAATSTAPAPILPQRRSPRSARSPAKHHYPRRSRKLQCSSQPPRERSSSRRQSSRNLPQTHTEPPSSHGNASTARSWTASPASPTVPHSSRRSRARGTAPGVRDLRLRCCCSTSIISSSTTTCTAAEPATTHCAASPRAGPDSVTRRREDVAARYGGEKFVVLLSDTELAGAPGASRTRSCSPSRHSSSRTAASPRSG